MLEIIVTGIACLLIGVLIGGFIEWNNQMNLHDDMLDRIDDLTRWNNNQKQQISTLKAELKELKLPKENSEEVQELHRHYTEWIDRLEGQLFRQTRKAEDAVFEHRACAKDYNKIEKMAVNRLLKIENLVREVKELKTKVRLLENEKSILLADAFKRFEDQS